MATMRREPCAILALMLCAWLPHAQGQKLDLKPGINVTATATTNAQAAGDGSRKDLVISTSPELSGSYEGARSRVDGRLRVSNVHYVRDSQPDQTLPDGELALKSVLVDQWGGLNASVQASQTPATVLTRQSTVPGATDGYTTTLARFIPYIRHSFDADIQLDAQLERSFVQSSRNTSSVGSPREDLQFTRHAVRLERRPVPVGTSLEWTGLRASALQENTVRAGASYALTEGLYPGLILGRDSIHAPRPGQPGTQDQQSGTIRGITLAWRPNERATLESRLERRVFGTGWKVDWNHRTPFFAWNIFSEREASTYASSLGSPSNQTLRGLLDRMLTTNNPDVRSRSELVDKTIAQRGLNDQMPPLLDPYSLTPTLRQTLQGRLVMMGQRNTVSLAAGMNKTESLALNDLPPIGDQSLERYVDANFNRRLTPITSLNAGVRWRHSTLTSNVTPNSTGRLRSLTWRGDISTRLSPQATATFGLRHQTSSGTQLNINTNDESAMYVGVGYRY